jgi:hypothetical protein
MCDDPRTLFNKVVDAIPIQFGRHSGASTERYVFGLETRLFDKGCRGSEYEGVGAAIQAAFVNFGINPTRTILTGFLEFNMNDGTKGWAGPREAAVAHYLLFGGVFDVPGYQMFGAEGPRDSSNEVIKTEKFKCPSCKRDEIRPYDFYRSHGGGTTCRLPEVTHESQYLMRIETTFDPSMPEAAHYRPCEYVRDQMVMIDERRMRDFTRGDFISSKGVCYEGAGDHYVTLLQRAVIPKPEPSRSRSRSPSRSRTPIRSRSRSRSRSPPPEFADSRMLTASPPPRRHNPNPNPPRDSWPSIHPNYTPGGIIYCPSCHAFTDVKHQCRETLIDEWRKNDGHGERYRVASTPPYRGASPPYRGASPSYRGASPSYRGASPL